MTPIKLLILFLYLYITVLHYLATETEKHSKKIIFVGAFFWPVLIVSRIIIKFFMWLYS